MKKPVIVGAQAFQSKKDALEFFRSIRNRYADGVRISEEDSGYLMDLVAIHHDAEEKIGCGISHFTVATDNRFGTRHFKLHRLDGKSDTDFSFHVAVKGPNPRRDRLEALRHAIACQILHFKAQRFGEKAVHTCPLRNIPVTENSYHVDHTPPNTFLKVANDWLAEQNIKIEEILITPPADNQTVTEMTNSMQRDSWQSYHAGHVSLRLLSPLGNLSDSKLTRL
ncbi:MAG: DCL family protein [Kiritimatiellia bacterium]|nr:DCL family protein [Kiritimatiellia bacterium]